MEANRTEQSANSEIATARSPWGKFDAHDGNSHHLTHHCADVAACFESIASLPTYRARIERVIDSALTSAISERLAVLAFLHDVGKLHPGFQAKGWPQGTWSGALNGHVAQGAAIYSEYELKPLANHLALAEMKQWGVDLNLLYAVLAHHGRPFMCDSKSGKRWEPVRTSTLHYDPLAAAEEMGSRMRCWFPLAFSDDPQPLPSNPHLHHLLSGLVSLSDWLGSDTRFFPFVPVLDPDYMKQARYAAQSAVRSIGLDVSTLQASIAGRTGFTEATGFPDANVQQRLVDDCPRTDQLLIFEAETGSGKTEAAYWRFARLFEAKVVDSLYFALPTRSAAIQLHGRINSMLKHLFGSQAPEAVLAVPGYMKVGEATGQTLPHWNVRWDDDGATAEEILVARWAAESSKRYLAATVAVGTVDQAMLGALCVKHAHLRSAALSRSLLVIDEVHASDSYMTEVQAHLLKLHLERGGHALLMSATLGSRARSKWLGESIPSYESAVAAPYPIVWSRSGQAHGAGENAAKEKAVAMRLLQSMGASGAAGIAIDAAKHGARVLLIRNTVQAAVDAWEAVRGMGGDALLLNLNGGPALHHGRFAPEDRRLLDAAVESALSPRARPAGGAIVIGTQTLEQSLDIDADLLISDLCPVDVLLQRIGRLHRHPSLQRPHGFEQTVCYVLSPEKGLAPLLKPAFENGLGAWRENGVLNGIYRDLSMLELTRRMITEHEVWVIPSMNRFLVEGATHPEKLEQLHQELGREWIKYWNEVVGADIANRGAARNVLLPFLEPFADVQFPSDEEAIRTRLGEEGARITFTGPVMGPFGAYVSGLTLPAHWSHGLQTIDPITPAICEGVLTLTIKNYQITYDRRGILRARQ
jgi:CRISPR-associated endonuclease/helicase Cas3